MGDDRWLGDGAPVARLSGVVRRYGEVTALDGVDLSIRAGQLLGLLGPNGAGKSTVINLLLGLRRAHAGTVELFGGSPQDPARRRRLGCTPQETALPATLRVGEVVRWVAGHFPDPVPAEELLEQFDLADTVRRQTGGLSGGQRRKLSVALALVGRPRFVVLDEPTTGLDIDARHELWQALRRVHAAGTTVLLTSHYLEEIEALAERVVVLHHGTVLADDTLGGVLSRVGVDLVSLRWTGPAGAAAGELAALPGVARHEHAGDREVLYAADADRVVRELVERGLPFSGVRVRGASLEEAFRVLTAAPRSDRRSGEPQEVGS
jgi:ABC-2 type transport system ATP-binding protein